VAAAVRTIAGVGNRTTDDGASRQATDYRTCIRSTMPVVVTVIPAVVSAIVPPITAMMPVVAAMVAVLDLFSVASLWGRNCGKW